MDFLDKLKDKLESLTITPPVIEIGSYRTNVNSVAIRPAPSSINSRYLNKDKIYPYSFQILVHHSDNFAGNMTTENIVQELDNKEAGYVISDNNSFDLISIVVTTTTNHVEVTEHGNLWTAIFQAELYIKGDEQ